jgi:pimeloyl-ACP methyl ester carboxylesterase
MSSNQVMSEKHFRQVAVPLEDRTIELEIERISPERTSAPLIVFLHEGLGSIAMWGDWPDRLCEATGCRGLVFSRYGYGNSALRTMGQKWPIDYMEQEATDILPALFEVLGIDVAIDKPILFGHSDGGTIALLHAAAFPSSVAAIVTVAPHVFVEEIGMARIAHLRQTYATGKLRGKLRPFHRDPDSVFRGWSDLWLSEEFRSWSITGLLPAIACPVLAVQGEQDQYGTLEQVYAIQRLVPQTQLVILDDCRHVPHQDQPQTLLNAVAAFVRSVCSH